MIQFDGKEMALPLSGVPSGELEMDFLAKRGSTPKGGGRMKVTMKAERLAVERLASSPSKMK